jgi:aminopeptidase N
MSVVKPSLPRSCWSFGSKKPVRTLAAFGAAIFALSLPLLHAQRLPDTVTPEHYTLVLTPDLKAATFTGQEKIEVDLKQASNEITLNAAEITFKSVSIDDHGQTLQAEVTEDSAKEQATFHFDQTLAAGHYTLSIDYTGILNNELRGFYLSKTARRNYAVTQFEPTDARRAFPSFDEPAFKATFSVTLIVPKGDTAISNTNEIADEPGPTPDEHTVKFATTPKMSTYLVAFLVGDFQCISGASDGIPIRACATPDKLQYAGFALKVSEFVLHYYDTYFGIKYPMPKLDMIAIPDFEAGAMENFGAITYRETAMLVDPKNSSIAEQQNVAVDVAHEMAHQWFGDMVTMQWWNNIWLNEGFATWMSAKPVTAMFPQWDFSTVVAEELNATLNLDAQRVTRTIRANADTPDQINQMFDGISYGKAAAVLNMVENYEGEQVFRQGVHQYLDAHMYANATAEDFWNAQTAASHQPIDKIMNSFISQPGVPELTFSTPQNGSVQVKQSRFFLNSDVKPKGDEVWQVPVCFKTQQAASEHCEVLAGTDQTLPVPHANVFFPDADGKGYYRFYFANEQSGHDVLDQFESALTPVERIATFGDLWAHVRADRDPVGYYLTLLERAKNDENAQVIRTGTGPVDTIRDRIAATPQEVDALNAWVIRTFKPEYERLGKPSLADAPNTKALRAELFAQLGAANDPDIIAQAKQIADEYLSNPDSTDANIARVALSIAAANGDAAFFDRLQHIYETDNNPQMKVSALHLMAEFKNPQLEQRALAYAVSGKVRNQDSMIELAIGLEDPDTRNVTWQFIQQHWPEVKAQNTAFLMGSYLVGAAGSFCSADKKNEVQQFFDTHKVPASDRALVRATQQIEDCMTLREQQESHLQQWLAGQK